MAGNDKNNTIYASKDGSNLWGGGVSNDTLIGGDGEDNFYYLLGDGKDEVTGADKDDTIVLAEMTLDDIVGIDAVNSGADIKFTFKDGGTLLVKGGVTGESTYKVGEGNYTYNVDGSGVWEKTN